MSAVLSNTQIEEMATAMGVSIGEAQKILGTAPREFKQLRDNAAFNVVITKAKNTRDRSGKAQVQLSFQALDDNGEPVRGAFGTTWIGFGISDSEFKYADVDAQERDIKAQGALLRASGEARFIATSKVIDDGNGKKRYFNLAGEEMTPEQTNAAFVNAKVATVTELRLRKEGSVEGYVGTRCVAIHESYEYTRDGETRTGRKFRLVPEYSGSKVPLITDPAEMHLEEV